MNYLGTLEESLLSSFKTYNETIKSLTEELKTATRLMDLHSVIRVAKELESVELSIWSLLNEYSDSVKAFLEDLDEDYRSVYCEVHGFEVVGLENLFDKDTLSYEMAKEFGYLVSFLLKTVRL